MANMSIIGGLHSFPSGRRYEAEFDADKPGSGGGGSDYEWMRQRLTGLFGNREDIRQAVGDLLTRIERRDALSPDFFNEVSGPIVGFLGSDTDTPEAEFYNDLTELVIKAYRHSVIDVASVAARQRAEEISQRLQSREELAALLKGFVDVIRSDFSLGMKTRFLIPLYRQLDKLSEDGDRTRLSFLICLPQLFDALDKYDSTNPQSLRILNRRLRNLSILQEMARRLPPDEQIAPMIQEINAALSGIIPKTATQRLDLSTLDIDELLCLVNLVGIADSPEDAKDFVQGFPVGSEDISAGLILQCQKYFQQVDSGNHDRIAAAQREVYAFIRASDSSQIFKELAEEILDEVLVYREVPRVGDADSKPPDYFALAEQMGLSASSMDLLRRAPFVDLNPTIQRYAYGLMTGVLLQYDLGLDCSKALGEISDFAERFLSIQVQSFVNELIQTISAQTEDQRIQKLLKNICGRLLKASTASDDEVKGLVSESWGLLKFLPNESVIQQLPFLASVARLKYSQDLLEISPDWVRERREGELRVARALWAVIASQVYKEGHIDENTFTRSFGAVTQEEFPQLDMNSLTEDERKFLVFCAYKLCVLGDPSLDQTADLAQVSYSRQEQLTALEDAPESPQFKQLLKAVAECVSCMRRLNTSERKSWIKPIRDQQRKIFGGHLQDSRFSPAFRTLASAILGEVLTWRQEKKIPVEEIVAEQRPLFLQAIKDFQTALAANNLAAIGNLKKEVESVFSYDGLSINKLGQMRRLMNQSLRLIGLAEAKLRTDDPNKQEVLDTAIKYQAANIWGTAIVLKLNSEGLGLTEEEEEWLRSVKVQAERMIQLDSYPAADGNLHFFLELMDLFLNNTREEQLNMLRRLYQQYQGNKQDLIYHLHWCISLLHGKETNSSVEIQDLNSPGGSATHAPLNEIDGLIDRSKYVVISRIADKNLFPYEAELKKAIDIILTPKMAA